MLCPPRGRSICSKRDRGGKLRCTHPTLVVPETGGLEEFLKRNLILHPAYLAEVETLPPEGYTLEESGPLFRVRRVN